MHLSFAISPANEADFLTHWAAKYNYPNGKKYTNNIGKPLTPQSVMELYGWKNGTGDELSAKKRRSVEANYPHDFAGDESARYLDHKKDGGAIWNIFFLHCLKPAAWPIFDQHTFRAMHYLKTGQIKEIGTTNRQKYVQYAEYRKFHASLSGASARTVDMALFAFGQFLKLAEPYV